MGKFCAQKFLWTQKCANVLLFYTYKSRDWTKKVPNARYINNNLAVKQRKQRKNCLKPKFIKGNSSCSMNSLIHITYFLQTDYFHCMWYFLSQKTLTWMFMLQSTINYLIWYHQERRFLCRCNTYKKTIEQICSDKLHYWSLEMTKIFLTAGKLVSGHALK